MRRTISLMMIAAFIAAFVMTVPFGMAAKADGAQAGTREYTSDIYYIQYNNSHKRTYTYSRPSSTHTGRCSVCGDVVQQAHVLNSSQSACSICGCPAQFIVKSQSVQDWRVLDKYLLPKEDKKGV